VRAATVRDTDALARLRWDSRSPAQQDAQSFTAFAPAFGDWFAAAISNGAWHVVVAESSAGAVVGCMYLQRIVAVPVPGDTDRAWGYVTHAYVSERCRNEGIGARLLAALIDRARAWQLMDLQVWPSRAAVSLYVRAGFLSPAAQLAGTAPDEASYVLPLD